MGNKIMLRESEIDFSKLIELNLNRKKWGERYTLFTAGAATVNIEMESFNFSKNIATFTVKFNYTTDTDNINDYFWIDFWRENMTITDFKGLVYRRLKREIKNTLNRRHTTIAEQTTKFYRKYDSDITEADLYELGFGNVFDALKNIKEEHATNAIDNLRFEAKDIWNETVWEPFIDDWKSKNPFNIDDFNTIINRIEKYLEEQE